MGGRLPFNRLRVTQPYPLSPRIRPGVFRSLFVFLGLPRIAGPSELNKRVPSRDDISAGRFLYTGGGKVPMYRKSIVGMCWPIMNCALGESENERQSTPRRIHFAWSDPTRRAPILHRKSSRLGENDELQIANSLFILISPGFRTSFKISSIFGRTFFFFFSSLSNLSL